MNHRWRCCTFGVALEIWWGGSLCAFCAAWCRCWCTPCVFWRRGQPEPVKYSPSGVSDIRSSVPGEFLLIQEKGDKVSMNYPSSAGSIYFDWLYAAWTLAMTNVSSFPALKGFVLILYSMWRACRCLTVRYRRILRSKLRGVARGLDLESLLRLSAQRQLADVQLALIAVKGDRDQYRSCIFYRGAAAWLFGGAALRSL